MHGESLRAAQRGARDRVVRDVSGVAVAARSRRHDVVAVLLDHRGRAAREIPEPVGELGGIDGLEALPRERSVAVERDVAQQIVAEGVGAEARDGVGELELHPG